MPNNFTNNYHKNPAFQNGLEGVAVKTAETLANLDVSNILYGTASLLVSCPGKESGEGVKTGSTIIPADCVGSASCHINGKGHVTASVTADGQVVGVQHITLTEEWNRVIIQDIVMFGGNEIEIHLEATKIEECQFWASGFQIEDSSPCHPYCDGDQDGCEWRDEDFFGVSFCIFENPIKATAIQHTNTAKVTVLNVGEVFLAIPEPVHQHTYNALVQVGSAGPKGAVTDFGVSGLTDPDPAQSYVSYNNAGITMSSAWKQSWGAFIPPQDYLVSNGDLLYSRAAFAALGWDFQSAAHNNNAMAGKVYAGISPLTDGATPPAYDKPRSIHTLVVANRINFVTNPSFEVSTAGWSAIGSATLARDATVTVGEIAVIDETILSAGAHSCNVTFTESFSGASITVPELLPGFNYIASTYVKAGPGMSNIVMAIGNGTASIQSTGGTGYSTGAYDVGPYGGFNPGSDLDPATWFRIWCIFTASGDSETLEITAASAPDATFPSHMWIDAVMVEQGELLQGYFDGSIGNDYTWDSKQDSAGLSRSYYYQQMAVKRQAVNNVLARHTPLGISFTQPVFSVPPVE